MFLDEKAYGEPPPKKEEWPTWYKDTDAPMVFTPNGYEYYVVLPQ